VPADPVVAATLVEAQALGRADVDVERDGPGRREPVELHAAGRRGRLDPEALGHRRAVDIGDVVAVGALDVDV